MRSKWVRCIHRGQVGQRWRPREKAHWDDSEDKCCNAGRQEYDNAVACRILDGTNQRRKAIFCPASYTTFEEHGGKITRNHCCQRING